MSANKVFTRSNSKVKINYIATLLNGKTTDSSTIEFVLGNGEVIKAWEEGVSMMHVGEKAMFIAPAHLAYGSYGTGDIPPYTTVIFDI